MYFEIVHFNKKHQKKVYAETIYICITYIIYIYIYIYTYIYYIIYIIYIYVYIYIYRYIDIDIDIDIYIIKIIKTTKSVRQIKFSQKSQNFFPDSFPN